METVCCARVIFAVAIATLTMIDDRRLEVQGQLAWLDAFATFFRGFSGKLLRHSWNSGVKSPAAGFKLLWLDKFPLASHAKLA